MDIKLQPLLLVFWTLCAAEVVDTSEVSILGITLPRAIINSYVYFAAGAAATFFAVLLLFVQCIRRFYETHFLQVFSSTSKIHLTHYVVGYFHYFGAFLAILSQAEGFVGQAKLTPTIWTEDIGSFQWIAAGIFMYAWYHQFMSNLILANLRKNDSGTYDIAFHRILL